CMPYGELHGGTVGAPVRARTAYPRCGLTIKTGDGDYLGHWDELLAGVTAGDIHLFNGWFADPSNQLIKRCYQEASLAKTAPALEKAAPFAELLADADAGVRYRAVARLAKPDAEQTAHLIEFLPIEKEWVVRRRMVVALGQSEQAA